MISNGRSYRLKGDNLLIKDGNTTYVYRHASGLFAAEFALERIVKHKLTDPLWAKWEQDANNGIFNQLTRDEINTINRAEFQSYCIIRDLLDKRIKRHVLQRQTT